MKTATVKGVAIAKINPRPAYQPYVNGVGENFYYKEAIPAAFSYYGGGVLVAGVLCARISAVATPAGCAVASPVLGALPWVAAGAGFFLSGFNPKKYSNAFDWMPNDFTDGLITHF